MDAHPTGVPDPGCEKVSATEVEELLGWLAPF